MDTDVTAKETIDQILREMRVVSREEWFDIAKASPQGGFGFNPMRQLQLRIRHNPLTFGPELIGLFFSKLYGVIERMIEWPKPKGWKVAKERAPNTFQARVGADMHPYKITEPAIDALESAIVKYGLTHKVTVQAAKDLIEVCCEDLDFHSAWRKPK